MKISSMLKLLLSVLFCFTTATVFSQVGTIEDTGTIETMNVIDFSQVIQSELNTTPIEGYLSESIFPVSENLEPSNPIPPPPPSNLTGDNYQGGGVANMVDKLSLKPSPGSFSSNVSINDNLFAGKTKVSIPLFTFSYYDYNMPVTIDNAYPQEIFEDFFQEPTFYLNSRIGGDWTLSIDEYKVVRQVNGIEDDNTTKGYFTSISQQKVNGTSTITNADVYNGLKGDWDTGIDVYHFSCPTVSGSFILDLNNGTFKIVSGSNFFVKYSTLNNELYSFTINDNQGNEYLFGGDSSTVEISQSKSDISSFAAYTYNNLFNVKAFFEVGSNGNVITPYNAPTNLFGYPPPSNNPIPGASYDPQVVFNDIIASGTVNNNLDKLRQVDYNSQLNRKLYVLFQQPLYPGSLALGGTVDDPEMRREKRNSGWYLKKITLLNGKSINFQYYNDVWEAFQTFSGSRVVVPLAESNLHVPVSGSSATYSLSDQGFQYYPCLPENLDGIHFPVNDSFVVTSNFVKKPHLYRIFDEENSSTITLTTGNIPRPYICNPVDLSNHPPETVFAGTPTYRLLEQIKLMRGMSSITVDLKNHMTPFIANYNGASTRFLHKDASTLDELKINGIQKYVFNYQDSRLKKIIYPTGATKEFTFTSKQISGADFKYYGPIAGFFSGNHKKTMSCVESITTKSENNTTVEKYEFLEAFPDMRIYYRDKTFRADIAACTNLAEFRTTSPMYNNLISGGTYFKKVKKYVNGQLMSLSEFQQGESIGTAFTMTSSISTPETVKSHPATVYEGKSGVPVRITEFKNGTETTPIKKTEIATTFETAALAYPSVYLVNIEAGPWTATSGSIRRGYSRYYFPFNYLPSQTKTTETSYLDTNSGITSEETIYRAQYAHSLGTNNIFTRSVTNKDSKGNYWITYYRNASDLLNTTAPNPSVSNLIVKNMLRKNILPTLEILSSKGLTNFANNKIHDGKAFNYKILSINGGIPVPASEKKYTGNTSVYDHVMSQVNPTDNNAIIFDTNFKDKVIYDTYDSNGRLVEYHNQDGMYTSIIWGYEKQFPVAKIENAKYNEISAFVSNIQQKSNEDNAKNLVSPTLKTALDNLRTALPNAMVTTYTHDRIDGVKSVTDPRGITSYYSYDDNHQLKMIKDNDGNIIEKYDYNYKTNSNYSQNFSVSDINWINPNSRFKIGGSLLCNIMASGGSGNYLYTWRFKKGSIIVASGTTNTASFYVNNESYAGDIILEFDVKDNYTNITISKSRKFYAFKYVSNTYTLKFNNIQENYLTSTANVVSPVNETLRFYVFNTSASSPITVNLNGVTATAMPYTPIVLEVPATANIPVYCTLTRADSYYGSCVIELQPAVNGSVDIVSPKSFSISHY